MIKCEECVHNKVCKYSEERPTDYPQLTYPFELTIKCTLFQPYNKKHDGIRSTNESTNHSMRKTVNYGEDIY